MMRSKPSMIDMMTETEVRSACKELSIDCERKRRRIAELEVERDRLLKHTGLCRAHWETPMNKRSDNIGCPICLTNRISELKVCLHLLYSWADNWDSPFMEDDEWIETDGPRIKAALKDSGGG